VKFRSAPIHPNAIVWRISEDAPMGKWVNKSAQAVQAVPKLSRGNWAQSSFDLLSGTEVTEVDPTTIPSELFDELFRPPKRRLK
jgi:hypothetical protein